MAKFYRLEHKETKAGVYSVGAVSMIIRKYWDRTIHPGPGDDSKLYEKWGELSYDESREYIFGFTSIEQYRAWFYDNEVLLKLEKENILLNLYESEDFFVGHTQMIARKSELKFIETLPILG